MARPVNPYIAGAPLRGAQGFFGRQDTLEWVQRELRNPATNALVLFGQRRIGKTSLLLQLQRTLSTELFLPVYFDLQDQATRLLSHVLCDLADTVAERAGLEHPDAASFDDRGQFFRRTFLPQLEQALGAPRRPVFLMDEFDVLDQAAQAELPESAAARTLFPFLRRIMTDDPYPAFVYIVGRRAEDLALDFTATFKASLVREIWTLDQASAEALVRQAEANHTLRFTDAAVARVLALTNNHPYLTQLLCQRIWERAYVKHSAAPPLLDAPEIESAILDALEAGNQALVWLWNGLSPAERIYASALAENSEEGALIRQDILIPVLSAYATRLRTRDVEMAPGDLVRRRMLEAAGDREYRFAVELFRRWVRQNKPLREVKDELDQVIPAAEELFIIGQRRFKQNRWEVAAANFRDALQENPRHFRARLYLGEALRELGQIDEAVVELERAYELDHDEARLPFAYALIAQARAREKAGDEAGALAAVERVLLVSPNEQAAHDLRSAIWTRRGDAALAQDNLDEALAAYREAGQAERAAQVDELKKRRALEAMEQRAIADAAQGNWAAAVNAYEQLVAQAPDDKSLAQWQASLAQTREEQELDQLFSEGVDLFKQKQWDQAQSVLVEVTKRRPGYRRGAQSVELLLRRANAEMERRKVMAAFRPRLVAAIFVVAVLGIFIVGAPQMLSMLAGTPTTVAIVTTELISTPDISDVTETVFAPSDTPPPEPETPTETDTASPKETETDTPSPTSTPTPIPRPRVAISANTSGRVSELAQWGRGAIRNAIYSPGGERLAVGATLGIYLYHAQTGEEQLFIPTGFEVSALAFSPNGERLAASGPTVGLVQMWRVADGEMVREFAGHEAGIYNLAFSPDNITLAAAAADGAILLWDADTAEVQGVLQEHRDAVYAVAFSPDGGALASGGEDGQVLLWDLSAQTASEVGRRRGNPVYSLAFSPDGGVLASGGADGQLILWDLAAGEALGQFDVEGAAPVTRVAFSPDGQTVASGAGQAAQLWEVASGILLWTRLDHLTDVQGLAFSPDEKEQVVLSADSNQVNFWRAVDASEAGLPIVGFLPWVKSVAFSTDSALLAVGAEDKTVHLWEVPQGVPLPSLADHPDAVYVVAFSPDSASLAAGAGTEVKLWSVADGAFLQLLSQHKGTVRDLAFSPDGALLASASEDSTAILWDAAGGQAIFILQSPNDPNPSPVLSAAFSPDGALLAVGTEEGVALLWRVADGEHMRNLTVPKAVAGRRPPEARGLIRVAFSADANVITAISRAAMSYSWTLDGEFLGGVVLDTGCLDTECPLLIGAAFSPDGAVAAGGFADGSVALWRTDIGEQTARLLGHLGEIWGLAFSPDGRWLASGSADGTVRLWGVRP